MVESKELAVDDDGFYCYEDGSFYDPDGFFFDANGYDKYGGYYDDNQNYVPGEGYEDEYYEGYENAFYEEDQEAQELYGYILDEDDEEE